MNETLSTTPLDLSAFDTAVQPPVPVSQPEPQAALPLPVELAPLPKPERLVEVANLPPEELAAALVEAQKINFSDTNSLLTHGEGVLAGIAGTSRQLLSGVRLGDAGEAGQIAAAVVDGIKILRISDLQAEAEAGVKPRSVMGRLLGGIAQAKTAFQGFAESRKQFLALMDEEQAKARKTKADLAVSIQLLDSQALAIRQALHNLKISIAAGQIALDRAEDELEQKRINAIASGEPADAAEVQAFRGAIANFRGKIGDMREALVGSAMLIPIIQQNRAAAETRMIKISNGMLVVIPRLM
ncbi:MAG: toxic anion resistance protein, partial [Rhodospirillales bacterium]|nr:toxic anion resistance protein [Rhodospirillales bacterium]